MNYLQKLKKNPDGEEDGKQTTVQQLPLPQQQQQLPQSPHIPQPTNIIQRLKQMNKNKLKVPQDDSKKGFYTPQPSKNWGQTSGLYEIPFFSLNQTQQPKPLVLGFCGLPNCGKSSVVKRLQKQGPLKFAVLDQQHFYVQSPPEGVSVSDFNFDQPSAIEWDLMIQGAKQLINREPFHRPIYIIEKNQRVKGESFQITPSDIIIIEGPLILQNEKLRNLMDLKIYIQADKDVTLSRRIMSKRNEFGDGEKLLRFVHKYLNMVKPAFQKYVEPSKRYADIVIPNYGFNSSDMEKNQGELITYVRDDLQQIQILTRRLLI